MSKLLVLIDGWVYARSVCEHAAWVASSTGQGVELLHVIGRREGDDAHGRRDYSGSLAMGARRALLKELSDLDAQRAKLGLERGRAMLSEAEAILREGGVEEVSSSLRTGDLIEEATARENGAAMMVVGKRGEAADFARLHLGSNVERLARASRLPVLVTARAFKPVRRVLVAHDAGPSIMKAVDHMARSPLFEGLDVTLLRVGRRDEAGERSMKRAVDMLGGAGLKAHVTFAEGEPERVIGERVEEQGFDMVVMGAYGHSRIRSLVIGSTTAEVMRACRVPLLLFR